MLPDAIIIVLALCAAMFGGAAVKTYTIVDIRALHPCYDPTRYLPEDWSGTAADVLRVTECPAIDRLWVVLHWIDDRTLRLFACWCARQALALDPQPDPRSVEAVSIAERFAAGEVDSGQLAAASDAAWAAALDAASDAASDAARDAAWVAAWVAALDAARAAAWAAASDAARDAARDAHLIEMLEAQ